MMTKYFSILSLFFFLSFCVYAENLERRITQINKDNIVIEIHHCISCGFRTRASMLSREIYKELGLKADLIEGETGSFDVYINGNLIFSKSKAKRFPEPEEILQKIKEYKSIQELSTTRED